MKNKTNLGNPWINYTNNYNKKRENIMNFCKLIAIFFDTENLFKQKVKKKKTFKKNKTNNKSIFVRKSLSEFKSI